MPTQLSIHIYCTIIDNYGDIGVCWRLARQLVNEYACGVMLWVDDWPATRQLIRELPVAPAETVVAGVNIGTWAQVAAAPNCIGDVLIEGFGCTLPDATLAQLAARTNKPVWVNLDYFSAEAWVTGFHLQSGYDAAVGTRRWFFFPGTHPNSGGILREHDLLAQRTTWKTQLASSRTTFLAGLGIDVPQTALKILCFAYANAPYTAWLDAMSGPVALWLCGHYSQAAFAQTDKNTYANVDFCDVPFVAQPDFDRLLWSADVLWVRGEDSLARALWSGKPFVWHIYPQADNAHHPKLLEWLADYTQPFLPALQAAYVNLHLAWNNVPTAPDIATAWQNMLPYWADWQHYSHIRSQNYAATPDLAQRLMTFITKYQF